MSINSGMTILTKVKSWMDITEKQTNSTLNISVDFVLYYFILIFNYYLIRIAHAQTDGGRTCVQIEE